MTQTSNVFDPDAYLNEHEQMVPDFDPDAYLSENEISEGSDDDDDDPRNLGNAMKGAVKHLGQVLGGGLRAAVTPIDTAKDVANTSPRDQLKGAYRSLRSVPMIGTAVDQAVTGLRGIPQDIEEGTMPWQSPGPKGSAVRQDFKNEQYAEDDKHQQEHPVSDFVQRAVGVMALPVGLIPQLTVISMDAYNASKATGASSFDAMRDARNAAAIYLTTLGGIKGAKGAKQVAGKIIKKEFKIPDSAIERYRENPEAVRAAEANLENPRELVNQLNDITDPIRDPSSIEMASLEVEKLKPKIKAVDNLVDSRKMPPIDVARELPEKIAAETGQLQAMSAETYNILDNSGAEFRAKHLIGDIQRQKRKLTTQKAQPRTGAKAAAYSELEKLETQVREAAEGNPFAGGWINAPTLKKFLQQLDSTVDPFYRREAGSLGPEVARQLEPVRRKWNKRARSIDEFATAMDVISERTALVKEMTKVFGTEKKAMSALKSAENPGTYQGFLVREQLAKWDAKHKTDFADRVRDYYDIPKQMQEAIQELEVQKLQAEFDAKVAHRKANQAISKIGPDSAEAVVKRLEGEKGFTAHDQLSALDGGPQLIEDIKNTGAARAFSKSTTAGSRRTKMGQMLGTAVGGLVGLAKNGPLGGVITAAMGSYLGFLADIYGGVAVRTALDAGMKLQRLQNTPYIDQIMKAAAESPKALSITHYTLSQRDKEYQRLMNNGGDDSAPN